MFPPRPSARWRLTHGGSASLALLPDGLRLALAGATEHRYANAQIDDYPAIARAVFPWHPPLRLTVRARFGGTIVGTAGFGLWNSPLSPLGKVLPALPAALWFLHAAPPNDMPLARGVAGHGWKAATIDATGAAALRLAPLAPLAIVLSRIPRLAARVWPPIQRALRIDETPLQTPDDGWHTYEIRWLAESAAWSIDGALVGRTDRPPQVPLGFIAWIDNQYLIATPQGRFGWGLRPSRGPAWLDIGLVSFDTE